MIQDHTYVERCKARDAMIALRKNHSRRDVAKMMDISRLDYISFIEGMNKRNRRGVPVGYIAPMELVRKVLAYDKYKHLENLTEEQILSLRWGFNSKEPMGIVKITTYGPDK